MIMPMKLVPAATLLPLAAGLVGGLLLSSAWGAAGTAPPQDERAQPGEQHEVLAEMAGSYDVRVELTPAPGVPAMVLPGSSEVELVLGGRFLLSRSVTGEGPGATETVNIMGFDRSQGIYTMINMDSNSTAMTYYTGSRDADGVLTFKDLARKITLRMERKEEGGMEQTAHVSLGQGQEPFLLGRFVSTPKVAVEEDGE